ncbi:MAG: sigma-70 family RNA polymerase sigma factor [Candidatus Omnitrophica bacterium]|jgi:RNA polymerase sigma factor (sigma-70 family)|nr:sigma-70 family RNA polymerase sigma factor [Candidatus Omnitrophota bacterium]
MSECLAQKGPAWDELIRRFGPLVHGTVRKQLRRFGFAARQDLAEDAYQDVFLSLTRDQRLGRVIDPKALPGYLAAMAVSKATDLVRLVTRDGSFAEWKGAGADGAAGGDEASGGDVELSCPRPNPRDEAQRRSLRDLIDRELNDLPQNEGLIARLKWQHDMTLDAIAKMMEIPTGTAATVLRRAREKVKLSLLEKGIEE